MPATPVRYCDFACDLSTRCSRPILDAHRMGRNQREHIHPRVWSEVRWRIRQASRRAIGRPPWFSMRRQLTSSACSMSLACTGSGGDPYEDHLTAFFDMLRKLLITTFHSVPSPSPSVRASIRRIGRRCRHQVVVMAERARSLLIEEYGIPAARVSVILARRATQ